MILAQTVSNLFHPFVVGPAAFLYFSLAGTEDIWFGWLVWVITLIATNVIVGVYVYLMKRGGKTTSVDVPERILRRRPFAIGVAGYAIATGILYWIDAPLMVVVLMSIYAVNTAIATVINNYWKISIHSMALAGTMVPFIYAFGGFTWLAVLLLPLMFWSRVKLGAHTPAQAIAGITMAFILTWIQLAIWIP